MASKYVCRSCMRALRSHKGQQLEPSTGRSTPKTAARPFTSSASRLQEPAPAQWKATPPVSGTESPRPKLAQNRSTVESIAKRIAKSAPETAGTYHAYGATEHFFNTISEIVDYDVPQVKTKEEVPKLEGGEEIGVATGSGGWYKELGLLPTFNNWAQLTMLHLYVLTTRFRCLPASTAKTWSQNMTDHFFLAAETRMDTLHSITQRGVRSKYLKDLFLQWRGVLVSYDEGLVKGDAVLAGAVWRNLFGGKEDVDPVRLAMVTAWLRREVGRVAGEADLMDAVRFGTLKSEEPVVLMKSHFMDKALPQ